LQDEIASLSAKKPEMDNLFQQKTNELNEQLTQKVSAATKKVAMANGYNHIISVEAAIIYPKADEITDKVKAELGIK
jgi:Skp family chaperone for outer membrane proteins